MLKPSLDSLHEQQEFFNPESTYSSLPIIFFETANAVQINLGERDNNVQTVA